MLHTTVVLPLPSLTDMQSKVKFELEGPNTITPTKDRRESETQNKKIALNRR